MLKSKHENTKEIKMTRQEFFDYCLNTYGTSPDYPFDDWNSSAVFRHGEGGKWYAIAMRVSRSKLGLPSDEICEIVNMKLPLELYGSFSRNDGVYPAYHMNKLHWISVLLSDASDEVVRLLTDASYSATAPKIKNKRRNNYA